MNKPPGTVLRSVTQTDFEPYKMSHCSMKITFLIVTHVKPTFKLSQYTPLGATCYTLKSLNVVNIFYLALKLHSSNVSTMGRKVVFPTRLLVEII